MVIPVQAQGTSWILRPIEVLVRDLTGDVRVLNSQGKSVAAVAGAKVQSSDSVVVSRRSRLELEFPNVAQVKLGPDTDLKVEEFLQAPVPFSLPKKNDGSEPSATRIALGLIRGDVSFVLRTLATERGSAFSIETDAGVLFATSGAFALRFEKSERGFALLSVKVASGEVRFEPRGERPVAVLPGMEKMYSVEPEAGGRAIRVREFSSRR